MMTRSFFALWAIAVVLLAPAAAEAEPVPGAPGPDPAGYRLEQASVDLSTTQAGAHPDLTVSFKLSETSEGGSYAPTRDLVVALPSGVIGNPAAFPTCTAVQFASTPQLSECPQSAQIGSAEVELSTGDYKREPIYNMTVPTGGMAARFGFFAGPFPVFVNVRLNPETNTVVAAVEGATSTELLGATTTFWGVPASPSHDTERLTPEEASGFLPGPPGGRQSDRPEVPFMTNPTSCETDREVAITARSYPLPDSPSVKAVPFPQVTGCSGLEFSPRASAAPTTARTSSATGLSYELALPTQGLEFPNLDYASELKKAVVTLPEGMSINPSQAEGLGACSEEDLAREAYDSAPNEGCPASSQIGTVIARTPVLDEEAEGSLYVATPYANPFGSLIALYMVLKVPGRGVLVKLPGDVKSDPVTGRLTTTFDNAPQLPIADVKLHFREGARAPLVSPADCGAYDIQSALSPWAQPSGTANLNDAFEISSGVDGGRCPSGGTPPFHPALEAGTLDNAAGSFSPFDLDLSRTDGEQEITHFSIKLPPGVTGKLAGIPFCPGADIAAAEAREATQHGGEEELVTPSCPAASEVGSTMVGAGVGPFLTYVPGKVYLAGPYRGDSLSIVAITAAKAGPFDLGTVVVREGLEVNPETAEVFVDATGGAPIPHIIEGIPVHARDIRIYVDRPDFVLNPTNCEPTSTASTVLGSGIDFESEADDTPVVVTTRFQAADCAALGYKPRLQLKLKGPSKRAGNPSLIAFLRPRQGDANSKRISVALPHSEFLDQGHIKTICTRVQFNAGAGSGSECPAGSVYGHAKVWTPLLSEPLEGPVFLRSSNHRLPDLVLALHGLINFDAVGRIDSVRGGIRNTFETVPDAPIEKVELRLSGGKRGLLENSVDLCKGSPKATADYIAQSGRKDSYKVPLQAQCKKKGGKGKKKSSPS